MNIRQKLMTFLLCVMLLSTGSAHAVVGTIVVALGRDAESQPIDTEFSANARVVVAGMQMDTKLHYQKDRLRDEAEIEGQRMTVIQRYDLGKTWVLMGPGMYMEYALGKAQQVPDYTLISKKEVGTETINGIETTKYETNYQSTEGRFGGFTWVNEDNIAVKGTLFAESGGRREEVSFELTDLKIGEQPDELFELPDGATKLDMGNFGGLMKGLQEQYGQ